MILNSEAFEFSSKAVAMVALFCMKSKAVFEGRGMLENSQNFAQASEVVELDI